MPEIVRLSRVVQAYTTSANIYFRPRSLPNNLSVDTVRISEEAREKSKQFLLKSNEESSPENPSPKRRAESGPDILHMSANASRDQVRKAYLAAIKQYHPDNFADLCPEFRELAEEKSKQINLAYKKLTGN